MRLTSNGLFSVRGEPSGLQTAAPPPRGTAWFAKSPCAARYSTRLGANSLLSVLRLMIVNDFSSAELRLMRGLRRPDKLQQFLDEKVAYNKEAGGPTCRSPIRVLRDMTA